MTNLRGRRFQTTTGGLGNLPIKSRPCRQAGADRPRFAGNLIGDLLDGFGDSCRQWQAAQSTLITSSLNLRFGKVTAPRGFKVEAKVNLGDRATMLISCRPADNNSTTVARCADVYSGLCTKENWQAPMRHVQSSHLPCAAATGVKAVLSQSLPG